MAEKSDRRAAENCFKPLPLLMTHEWPSLWKQERRSTQRMSSKQCRGGRRRQVVSVLLACRPPPHRLFQIYIINNEDTQGRKQVFGYLPACPRNNQIESHTKSHTRRTTTHSHPSPSKFRTTDSLSTLGVLLYNF